MPRPSAPNQRPEPNPIHGTDGQMRVGVRQRQVRRPASRPGPTLFSGPPEILVIASCVVSVAPPNVCVATIANFAVTRLRHQRRARNLQWGRHRKLAGINQQVIRSAAPPHRSAGCPPN